MGMMFLPSIQGVVSWPFNPDHSVLSLITTLIKLAVLVVLLNIIVVVAGGIISQLRCRQPFPEGSPEFAAEPSNVPLYGSRRFFYDRWRFFREWSRRTASGYWSYYIGVNQMVGLSGAEGRQTIFQTRELNFEEGINLLFGFTSTKNSKGEAFNDFFLRRIKGVLQSDHLEKILPQLISDVRTKFDSMAASMPKIMDPFDVIYGLIFQLTMRALGCDEAADDPKLARAIIKTLGVAESCTTAETVVFPWFPLFIPRIRRTLAFLNLYSIFCGFLKPGIIRQRIQSGAKHDDALDVYLRFGDNELDTFLLIVAALFSGQVNSGFNAGWTLVYLAANPSWRTRALSEIRFAADQYDPNPLNPLADKLARIPLQTWETRFPVLDACLRETIRMQTIGVVCRKNTSGHAIPLCSSKTNPKTSTNAPEILPPGAYATYHLFDAHRDPSLYPDPETWDPSRWLSAAESPSSPRSTEAARAPLAFLGWGGGRHVCVGMRFARLENAVLTAHWLALFDFEVVDRKGKRTETLPRLDLNASSAHRPRDPCRVRFWGRVEDEERA